MRCLASNFIIQGSQYSLLYVHYRCLPMNTNIPSESEHLSYIHVNNLVFIINLKIDYHQNRVCTLSAGLIVHIGDRIFEYAFFLHRMSSLFSRTSLSRKARAGRLILCALPCRGHELTLRISACR